MEGMMLKLIVSLVALRVASAALCESKARCDGAASGSDNTGCVAKYSGCKICAMDLTKTQRDAIIALDKTHVCHAATADGAGGGSGDTGGLKDCCTECEKGYKATPLHATDGLGQDCTKCNKAHCAVCSDGVNTCKTCMAGYTIETANTCDGPCASGYTFNQISKNKFECKQHGAGSASGDPHVTNIRGEAFDVLRAGDLDVIVLPRGASPTSPIHHLTVQAKIARASKKLCEATFIERVSAFGSWLGGEQELVIDAGTVHDMTPLRLKLGSDKEWTDWDKVNNILNADNTQIPKTTITSSRDKGKHPTIKVAFDIGEADISLLVSLFQHKHFSFLNLDVNGLENYEAEVGGILGLDSHSLATAPDVECEHKFERKHSEEGLEIVASKMTANLGVASS